MYRGLPGHLPVFAKIVSLRLTSLFAKIVSLRLTSLFAKIVSFTSFS
jgi:hypothetical protein